ncbi:MAG: creatininase family protein [Alphaproteobacteria bacterium]|nr:creatininase family protein [Alphaproteobacteria bacterium]
MLLQLSTWIDVENYLKNNQSIIIPIGSTEQHGPNGLIGTDAICPEFIAREIGKRKNIMIAPTLAIGMAQHHLAFPGSITLRPSTMISVIKDVVNSLMCHGFRFFYFLNGHGGNVATLTAAFSEIYADRSLTQNNQNLSIECYLRNWWQGDDIQKLSKELFDNAEGAHATPSEVSLTWHCYPEAAKPMNFDPMIAPNGTFTDAIHYRKVFPDGRIGSNPGLASIEAGKRIYECAVNAIQQNYQEWIDNLKKT